jgi:hypothetical protein
MNNIIEIFPTKIYKISYPEIESFKQRVIPRLNELLDNSQDEKFELMRGGGECSYGVFHNLHTWDETKELVKFIACFNENYIQWKNTVKYFCLQCLHF